MFRSWWNPCFKKANSMPLRGRLTNDQTACLQPREPDVAAPSLQAMKASPDPLKPLKNQKALVTGANSGIGEACALALGAAGAELVVNYHSNPEEAERVVDAIEQNGSRAIAFRADVSRE